MDDPAGIARRVFDAYTARDPEALRMLYTPTARTRRPGWPDDGGVDELVASAEMDMVLSPTCVWPPYSPWPRVRRPFPRCASPEPTQERSS
jgi:hypothetical protein